MTKHNLIVNPADCEECQRMWAARTPESTEPAPTWYHYHAQADTQDRVD